MSIKTTQSISKKKKLENDTDDAQTIQKQPSFEEKINSIWNQNELQI